MAQITWCLIETKEYDCRIICPYQKPKFGLSRLFAHGKVPNRHARDGAFFSAAPFCAAAIGTALV